MGKHSEGSCTAPRYFSDFECGFNLAPVNSSSFPSGSSQVIGENLQVCPWPVDDCVISCSPGCGYMSTLLSAVVLLLTSLATCPTDLQPREGHRLDLPEHRLPGHPQHQLHGQADQGEWAQRGEPGGQHPPFLSDRCLFRSVVGFVCDSISIPAHTLG